MAFVNVSKVTEVGLSDREARMVAVTLALGTIMLAGIGLWYVVPAIWFTFYPRVPAAAVVEASQHSSSPPNAFESSSSANNSRGKTSEGNRVIHTTSGNLLGKSGR